MVSSKMGSYFTLWDVDCAQNWLAAWLHTSIAGAAVDYSSILEYTQVTTHERKTHL